MENFFSKFSLANEKESFDTVYSNIENGVVFRGTNLWILIFAIFVASLGLNVNSTAVIIGAMLISPLMGPIMGMGLGLAINEIDLFRKALYNFGVATLVALATSTVFFLMSPINDAHSEILARTSPNVYDVLIALFGGLAGTLATASRQKGNVIPGVAIATALMPPLCTAGYGLATLQWKFFFGAFYLFVINTVFIALATLAMSRFLKFPVRSFVASAGVARKRYAITFITMLTLVPSIWFAYQMLKEADFTKRANAFIRKEAIFEGDYLLSSDIVPAEKRISLVFGGRQLDSTEIEALRSKTSDYRLDDAVVEVKQGFAFLSDKQLNEKVMIGKAIDDQGRQVDSLKKELEMLKGKKHDTRQVYQELKTQYPQIREAVIQQVTPVSDSSLSREATLVVLNITGKLSPVEKDKIGKFLRVRLSADSLRLVIVQ